MIMMIMMMIDDNVMVAAECELSSPRESFQREGDDEIPQISNNKILLPPQTTHRNLIKAAKMGDKLRLQKLAFSRVLSRDLGL